MVRLSLIWFGLAWLDLGNKKSKTFSGEEYPPSKDSIPAISYLSDGGIRLVDIDFRFALKIKLIVEIEFVWDLIALIAILIFLFIDVIDLINLKKE